MKPRARRVTMAAALIGATVIIALAIVHRRAVRDHVEAWRFQLTRETEMIRPDPKVKAIPMHNDLFSFRLLLHILAAHSDCPVIFDPDQSDFRVAMDLSTRNALSHEARAEVQALGHRVVEQRFPRRAYVVLRVGGWRQDRGAAVR